MASTTVLESDPTKQSTEISTGSLQRPEGRIEIPAAETFTRTDLDKRVVQLDDLVSRRIVEEPRLSPDGKLVAFFLRQGFRDTNESRQALYVMQLSPANRPRKLIETTVPASTDGSADGYLASNLRWSPDGSSLTYLSAHESEVEIYSVPVTGGPAHVLVKNKQNILSYEWSPDGSSIAFLAPASVDSEAWTSAIRQGVVFDEASMTTEDISEGNWLGPPLIGLWLVDLSNQTSARIWASQAGQRYGATSGIAWSPDGQRISLNTGAPQVLAKREVIIVGVHNHDVVKTGMESHIPAVWSPDGQTLAIIGGSRAHVGLYQVQGRSTSEVGQFSKIRQVWWHSSGRTLTVLSDDPTHSGAPALFALALPSGHVRRIAPKSGVLDALDVRDSEAIGVWQDPVSSANPVRIDLSTGTMSPLVDVNPEFRAIYLAPVEHLTWKNRYGQQADGFLVKPLNYRPGTRYPLLIVHYGFQGRFSGEAEWFTNCATQAFARDGFVVLEMNQGSGLGDSPESSDRFVRLAYGPVASMEAIIVRLAGGGLVDRDRVGVMGRSHGSELTLYALTLSKMFKAASGPLFSYDPFEYLATGDKSIRSSIESYFGGPPSGPTLANWVRFSPEFNMDKVTAPSLLEYGDREAIYAVAVRSMLDSYAVPVDLIVYPGAGHLFRQPEHRFHSMQLNLDWFEFWLQDREDQDATKRTQYARWEQLRQRWEAKALPVAR